MTLNVHEIVLKVGVRVGIAVGKVDRVVVVLELDVERQSEGTNISGVIIIKVINQHLMIVPRAVDVVIVVPKVGDVFAAPPPSDVIVRGICR